MTTIQLACIAIIVLYLAVRLARAEESTPVLGRLLHLVILSWVSEDTMIRAYHFYSYSREWWLFIDQVPLLVVLIWPIVIDSAIELANVIEGKLGVDERLLVAGFVLADASLIEPIAVAAGLWSWTEPGLFGVPPIGILGWAVFAWAATSLTESRPGRTNPLIAWLFAPIFSHLALLALWWGLFRWINRPVDASVAIAVAWTLSVVIAVTFFRKRARAQLWDLVVRVPAASFFFVLLGAHASENRSLIAYAIAFAPPYLTLFAKHEP